LQLFPAGVAAISTLLIPVVGVIAGALILGEPIGWPELAALALVAAALHGVHANTARTPPE